MTAMFRGVGMRFKIITQSSAQFDEGVVQAFESAYEEIERIRERYRD